MRNPDTRQTRTASPARPNRRPRVGARRCVWTLLGLLAAATIARAETLGDLSFWVQPLTDVSTFHGYREVNVNIVNSSPERPHRVEVYFPRPNDFMGDMLARISGTAMIAPGGTASLRLYQPPLPIHSSPTLDVRIDGGRPESLALTAVQGHANRRFTSAAPHPVVLISRGINQDDFERTMLDLTGHPLPAESRPAHATHGRTTPFALGRAEAEVDAWSPSWLAYSAFDGIALTAAELPRLPGEVRLALERYVACGGSLVVLGDNAAPFSGDAPARTLSTTLTMTPLGFGEVFVTAATLPVALVREDAKALLSSWQKTLGPWNGLPNTVDANRDFPVIDSLSIPVRAITLLIVLFAFLIGPVNIFTTARLKRPIWLLWTIPAISAVACTVVIAYAFLSEGITPTVRTGTLTLLDQTSRRAITLGVAGYYCPLTPADGLQFAADSELTPLLDKQGGSARRLDWTRGQHFEHGWITARVPAHFLLRKAEGRRERLSVHRRDDGRLDVVNGLGAPVDQLWVADHHGRLFHTAALPAGQRQTLAPVPTHAHATALNPRALYAAGNWLSLTQTVTNTPAALLQPDTYLAVLPAAPFVENALPRNVDARRQSIVIGRYTPEDPS